jgi:hypothetical protein
MGPVAAPRARALLVGLAGLVTVAGAAGCASDQATEPTVASVDFTPRLVLEVRDDGLRWIPGPRADDSVSVDPPRARQGAVVEVVNRTTSVHRVTGDDGQAFDTGTLDPGESTTIVLSKPLTADRAIRIAATDTPGESTLVVTPRATTG